MAVVSPSIKVHSFGTDAENRAAHRTAMALVTALGEGFATSALPVEGFGEVVATVHDGGRGVLFFWDFQDGTLPARSTGEPERVVRAHLSINKHNNGVYARVQLVQFDGVFVRQYVTTHSEVWGSRLLDARAMPRFSAKAMAKFAAEVFDRCASGRSELFVECLSGARVAVAEGCDR